VGKTGLKEQNCANGSTIDIKSAQKAINDRIFFY